MIQLNQACGSIHHCHIIKILELGEAIPPYSGIINMNPSEFDKFLEIFVHLSPQNFVLFFSLSKRNFFFLDLNYIIQ